MNKLDSPGLDPEELANQLDEALAPRGNISPASGHQDDPRIKVAVRLANEHHPQMSPEMLSRVQSKVITAHRQHLKRQRVWRSEYTLAVRLVAAFAIIMVFFSATALPALASSVPGEFWYPFKRNLENIEISIASSPSARAGVYLTQAERRVEEAQVLLQRQVFDANLMLDARNSLSSFDQLTPQLGASLANTKSRAALVTESMALLLQEAEQNQIISGDEVVALLPTVIPLPSITSSPSLTPTIEPSTTLTPTAVIPVRSSVASPADVLPSIAATVEPTLMHDSVPTMTVESSLPPVNTGTSTSQITATATSQPALATMYAIENANVRSQPSRDQSVITILQQGAATDVIGEDNAGKWWHVRLQDGRLGWVAKFLLSVDKPASSAGNNGSAGSNSNGDFGCDHPGNYCNAPGQTHVPGNSGNANSPPDGHKP